MTSPLWTWDELRKAALATNTIGAPERAIAGFSIDTRSIRPGEVFVALKDQRDGHDFVTRAFEAGAAAALVSHSYSAQSGDGALIRVDDTLRALERIGMAARARLSSGARVVAITGSAGKTGTKEMLRACFEAIAPARVHASEKSYNNHWGVPLTLARMPADTQYAVFEIGMNHAGEIEPLSTMVRPHAAIVTMVDAVHLEHFNSVEEIADAKSEIFSGLVTEGVAIVKRDSPYFERQKAKALEHGNHRIITFGFAPGADVYALSFDPGEHGSAITARVRDRQVHYEIAMPGRHIAENSLAVVAALDAAGCDLDRALAVLATLPPPPGRGARALLKFGGGHALLIDESYNANPASMRAALCTLATVPRANFPRRIAVLGDMLELGSDAPALHESLKGALDDAGVDVIFACGTLMKGLYDAVPDAMKGAYRLSAAELEAPVLEALHHGDVVIVKASNGTRLGPLVETLKTRFG